MWNIFSHRPLPFDSFRLPLSAIIVVVVIIQLQRSVDKLTRRKYYAHISWLYAFAFQFNLTHGLEHLHLPLVYTTPASWICYLCRHFMLGLFVQTSMPLEGAHKNSRASILHTDTETSHLTHWRGGIFGITSW